MALARTFVAVAAALGIALSAAAAGGQTVTRDEALSAIYPGATVAAERLFLTQAQQQQASQLAGIPVPSALVGRHVARASGKVIGRAYVDTHVVRTKKQTLLVALDANGAVLRVEATAFLEPPEYFPPRPWREQYRGRRLEPDTAIHRGVRPLAGATLTARSVNDAVRRALAIDRVLQEAGVPR